MKVDGKVKVKNEGEGAVEKSKKPVIEEEF